MSGKLQRRQLDFVQSLNRDLLDRKKQSSQIEGVIESYELAFRMQSAVPELMDSNDENESTLNQYGINNRAPEHFGRQCLLARKFVESGVRYIQVSTDYTWDHHQKVNR